MDRQYLKELVSCYEGPGVNLRLTSGLGGGEGLKVEEFKTKGVRNWMVRGSGWREGESLGTP